MSWYKDGLSFACTNCSYCCSVEPGYVFLSAREVQEMADYLSLKFDEFIEIYCRKVDMGTHYMISLKEKENYDCIFLSKEGCKVYPARPMQCSTYPFWPSVMESKETWDEEAKSCPGINKGRKISLKVIEQVLKGNSLDMPLMILKK